MIYKLVIKNLFLSYNLQISHKVDANMKFLLMDYDVWSWSWHNSEVGGHSRVFGPLVEGRDGVGA